MLAHVRGIAAEGPLGADAIARLFERIIDEARRSSGGSSTTDDGAVPANS